MTYESVRNKSNDNIENTVDYDIKSLYCMMVMQLSLFVLILALEFCVKYPVILVSIL